MASSLDLDELTTAIEDFNTIFIRLPSVRKLNFSTLSVLHTLSRKGPLRLTELTAKLEREGLATIAGFINESPFSSAGISR